MWDSLQNCLFCCLVLLAFFSKEDIKDLSKPVLSFEFIQATASKRLQQYRPGQDQYWRLYLADPDGHEVLLWLWQRLDVFVECFL